MSWESIEIRHLRLRLGWSRSDLARRLATDSQVIADWEEGRSLPEVKLVHLLDLLAKQAEVSAEDVSFVPVAEHFLDEAELDQCERGKLKSRHLDN